MGVRLAGSDSAAPSGGANASAWRLTNKAVVILPRIDHSSFCPGFQVPGDVFPAEASQKEAMAAIGASVGAFLALHTPQSAAVQAAAYDLLAEKLAWTRLLLAPLQAAYKYEAGSNDISGNDKTAPLCPVAQKLMAGSA